MIFFLCIRDTLHCVFMNKSLAEIHASSSALKNLNVDNINTSNHSLQNLHMKAMKKMLERVGDGAIVGGFWQMDFMMLKVSADFVGRIL